MSVCKNGIEWGAKMRNCDKVLPDSEWKGWTRKYTYILYGIGYGTWN